jgi:hypothetical protein
MMICHKGNNIWRVPLRYIRLVVDLGRGLPGILARKFVNITPEKRGRGRLKRKKRE